MTSAVYIFAEFTLDAGKRTLVRESAEVKLKDRDFDVLVFLIENSPNLCSFDEIIQGVWGGTSVANSSVEKAIANIRRVLNEDATKPRFIKTVRTKGYHFFGDYQKVEPSEESEAQIRQAKLYESGSTTPAQRKRQAPNINTKKALPFLAGILLMALGVFLWQASFGGLANTGKIVFEDSFSSGEIDPSRWQVKGKSARVFQGEVKLSVEETDNPGVLRSEYFSVDPSSPITIESRIKIQFSQNMKDKVYFGGFFGCVPKTIGLEKTNILEENAEAKSLFFGVRYMNYDSEQTFTGYSGEAIQEIKTEGFFLVRNGGRPNVKSEYADGKISERIDPSWGDWFEQRIVYDPAVGQMTYFINGEKKGQFDVGRLQAKDNEIRFEIIPWGWWVNHSIEIDYIKVRQ
ncbi:MAG TPA: winged helix-turn-helix domain-containing protein [Pyrinomonadaceae bacterium]|jgi:DNA-binding winged helix-turn-helix (wHTH) protein